jgi:hypothetical protein
MKNLLCLVIFITSVSLVVSCSSIINGSKQNVSIRADPLSADIFVDGELAGTGIAEVKLKRGKDHVIEAKLDGYRTAKVTTDRSLTGWFWGNCILGGVIGMAIDLITGSAYDVDPEHVSLNLEHSKSSIDKHVDERVGELKVISPEGQCLATVNITWE